jgi:serpin B
MKPLLSSLFACLVWPPTAASPQTPPSAPTDKSEAVDGNNAFAVALYGQLRNQSGNLFFSPASISTALAMTYAGARGDTASQMAKTLHFTLPPERLHPAMGALLADLNATHNGYELHAANALWAERETRILDEFLKLNKVDYGAGFNQVDFKGATEAARSTINRWVEQKTGDKIKDLLQAGVLSSETKLVLTNAIYFKGEWQTPFDKEETSEEDFHLSPAQTVKAPLMERTGAYSYLNGESLQALELPYKSGELSMIVFLPNDVGGLPALERSLTASNLKQWLAKLRPVRKVIVAIPKFKLTRQFQLKDTLGAMGMPKAFEAGAADFSGMTGNRELCISAVIHKAFIDLDEQGTEAAAATAVVMHMAIMPAPDPAPPPVFRADHPFIFLIRDNRSGSILFLGRVTDPTK